MEIDTVNKQDNFKNFLGNLVNSVDIDEKQKIAFNDVMGNLIDKLSDDEIDFTESIITNTLKKEKNIFD